MARKPRTNQRDVALPTNGNQAGGQAKYSHQFVNVYLNEVDENWLSENDLSADGWVCEAIADLAPEYEFTVRQDKTSGKWNAMLKCTGGESVNNGFILSVRASNPFDALYGMLYAHLVKFHQVWGSSGGATSSRFN